MEPVLRTPPESTKEEIRRMVWKYIEDKNLANFPRPVYNRIPNFKAAAQACNKLPEMQEFRSSRTVKMNPDRPQEQGASSACAKVSELQSFTKAAEIKVDPDKPLEGARLLILQAQKTLLVPTPCLRTGLFNKITPPPKASKQQLRVCSTSQGVKDFSVTVGLDAQMKVDLVVVGSVAVSEKGFRIGKGEGYADMEYGMMASMGAVTDSTVVVTVVHDCQVVEIPKRVIESHDLTVNYILTPTRIIKTDCQLPKPQGIIWFKLDTEKLEKIPILKQLRSVEEQAGKDVALGEALTKATQRLRPNSYKDAEGDLKHDRGAALEQTSRQSRAAVRKENRQDGARLITDTLSSLFVGSIPAELRVSELKSLLRQKEASPLRLTWHGAQHRAFLDYTDHQAAERALLALQDLSVNGHKLLVELAKSQRKTRPHQAKPGLQQTHTVSPEKPQHGQSE